MRRPSCLALLVCALVAGSAGSHAAGAIEYHFTFPEPQHRWMQVEATFPDLPAGALELRMSRSSPGRYSLHDFAKNVYDVHVFGRDGGELTTTRPDPDGWSAVNHGGWARLRYRIYGDLVDGTYLAIDTTHAHINMPAAIMWARGLDDRPSSLTFTPPAGYEFVSLVQAVLIAGGRPLHLSDESRARIAAVNRPVTLQVFTTPT